MKRPIYLLIFLLALVIAVPICAKRYADYIEKSGTSRAGRRLNS